MTRSGDSGLEGESLVEEAAVGDELWTAWFTCGRHTHGPAGSRNWLVLGGAVPRG